MIQVEYLRSCFDKGLYNSILQDLGPNLISSDNPHFEEITCLQIGSMVFLGSLIEAEKLFQTSLQNKDLSPLFFCRCYFYLGIGHVRKSDYKKAVQIFAKNLFEFRKHPMLTASMKFYLFQGIAFYRFFQGRYKSCSLLAQKAYEAALESQFSLGQILSLDLLAHSLCLQGSVRRGIFEFEKAIGLAETVGNGGILAALKISKVKYSAQFGLDIGKTIHNLQQAIQLLNPQDTYSKAELHLELSRQLILRGQNAQAQAQLESASPLIYSHQNRRQSAVFNLRFAHLLLLKGEAAAALALTQSVRQNLDLTVDHAVLCQVNGLENKINSSLSQKSQNTEMPDKPVTLIDLRIRNRRIKSQNSQFLVGEDPLGDLIDLVDRERMDAFDQVKKFKLFGLLPLALQIPFETKGIYLGPHRHELITLDRGNISYHEKGLTAPLRKMILTLVGNSFKSKEFLVEQVWGYSYDPTIHDAVLYATIGKLRKILDLHSAWIEWANEGYRLNPSIQVLTSLDPQSNKVEPKPQAQTKSHKGSDGLNLSDLNARQFKMMRSLKKGQFISVKEHSKNHQICSMTAFRDLAALHKSGLLLKFGKGRATVYALSKP